MTYEIGKYYRLPDGDKALYVGGKTKAGGYVFAYADKGSYKLYFYSKLDLPEWKEPREWTAWVNVYEDLDTGKILYGEVQEKESDCKSLANTHSEMGLKLIARFSKTWEEGEGME